MGNLVSCSLLISFLCCHNPSLGLANKARACEGASQKWSPGVTFHAPGNVGECEGMNLHTPKWVPTLGVGVPMASESLESNCKGQNPLDWKVPYIIGKLLERWCLKWARMTHLDIQTQVMAKKRLRIKLAIWLPTTKSWDLPRFSCLQVACHITWKGLQLCFRP
jgi:hypothetical protein